MKKEKRCKERLFGRAAAAVVLCLLFCLLPGLPNAVMAEEIPAETVTDVVEAQETGTATPQWVEQELLTMETAGEFTVMFYYEGEQPEIIFISPTGVEYKEGAFPETEFLSAHGDGWSTYKVWNAEAGQWKVRCDKKNNEEIEYTLVDMVESICIQEFSLIDVSGTTATVRFEATKGEEATGYHYTIYAVTKEEQTTKQKLATGFAYTGEPVELFVDLTISSCDACYLLLEVVHSGEDLETFDTMETDAFAYDNPNTAPAMAEFTVSVNMETGLCEVDWSQYRIYGDVAYKLEVIADRNTDEAVYRLTTEDTCASFYYPASAQLLELTLSSVRNGVTSESKTKQIDVKNGEYIKILTEEISASATLEMEYNVKALSELYVVLNDKSGVYAVNGKDAIWFTMQNGWNQVEAYFDGEDGTTYRVSKDIYYTWLAPELTLYEELDGKTLYGEIVTLSGSTKNAATLTINGSDVPMNEAGGFCYELPLEDGANTITVVATTEDGISATKTLSITKGAVRQVSGTATGIATAGKMENETAVGLTFVKYLPMVGSVFLGVVLLLGFFLCFVAKKRGVAIALAAVFAVATGMAGYFLFCLHDFNHSVAYTRFARNSVENAAKYLEYETYMKWAVFGTAGLLVVTVLGIVTGLLVGKRKKKREA